MLMNMGDNSFYEISGPRKWLQQLGFRLAELFFPELRKGSF